jgi:hypothetical protein
MTDTDRQFALLCRDLDRQINAIGEDGLDQHRLCPLCLTYVERACFDEHMLLQHGYETLTISRRRT